MHDPDASEEIVECYRGIDIPADEVDKARHHTDNREKCNHGWLIEWRAVGEMIYAKKDLKYPAVILF